MEEEVPALCESTWEHWDGQEEHHYWAMPVVATWRDAALSEKQAVVGYRDRDKTGKQRSASQGDGALCAFGCVTHDVIFFNRGPGCELPCNRSLASTRQCKQAVCCKLLQRCNAATIVMVEKRLAAA